MQLKIVLFVDRVLNEDGHGPRDLSASGPSMAIFSGHNL